MRELEHREFFEIDQGGEWEVVGDGIVARTVAGWIDHDLGRGRLTRLARWAPGARVEAGPDGCLALETIFYA